MKTTPWKFTALGLSALLAGTTAAADDRVLGTVIGAGVGAVIGHQVGGNQGAVIGGAIGAAAGNAVTRDRADRDDRYYAPTYASYAPAAAPVYYQPVSSYRQAPVVVTQAYAPPRVVYVSTPPGHAKRWHKHHHKHHARWDRRDRDERIAYREGYRDGYYGR